MKKLVMTVAVLACAASFASAEVTSVNIVGYTKVQAVGGELSLVSVNFDNGGTTLQDLIGTDLPSLSSVFLWDKAGAAYQTASLNTRGAWVPDLVVNSGDAFWIQAAGSGTNELVFSGDVSLSNTVITLPAGIVATGYYYPVTKDFTATQMSVDLPGLSSLFLWDEETQGYQTWSKNTRGAWVGTGAPVLDPVTGFWIDNAGGQIDVDEPVPFTP